MGPSRQAGLLLQLKVMLQLRTLLGRLLKYRPAPLNLPPGPRGGVFGLRAAIHPREFLI